MAQGISCQKLSRRKNRRQKKAASNGTADATQQQLLDNHHQNVRKGKVSLGQRAVCVTAEEFATDPFFKANGITRINDSFHCSFCNETHSFHWQQNVRQHIATDKHKDNKDRGGPLIVPISAQEKAKATKALKDADGDYEWIEGKPHFVRCLDCCSDIKVIETRRGKTFYVVEKKTTAHETGKKHKSNRANNQEKKKMSK